MTLLFPTCWNAHPSRNHPHESWFFHHFRTSSALCWWLHPNMLWMHSFLLASLEYNCRDACTWSNIINIYIRLYKLIIYTISLIGCFYHFTIFYSRDAPFKLCHTTKVRNSNLPWKVTGKSMRSGWKVCQYGPQFLIKAYQGHESPSIDSQRLGALRLLEILQDLLVHQIDHDSFVDRMFNHTCKNLQHKSLCLVAKFCVVPVVSWLEFDSSPWKSHETPNGSIQGICFMVLFILFFGEQFFCLNSMKVLWNSSIWWFKNQRPI